MSRVALAAAAAVLLATPALGASAVDKATALRASKATPDLRELHSEYQAHLGLRALGIVGPAFRPTNPLAMIRGASVVIDAVSDTPGSASLPAALRRLGAERVTTFGRITSARLPLAAVPALERVPGLRFARPSYAVKSAGSVTSQGDQAMAGAAARAAFGVDGTGVTVGTLSDSYDCLGGAGAGVTSGDLPAGVVVLNELAPCAGATDEGRAMMEIVHDVAPGAAQAFHTAFEGQASFAQGIVDLANAGAKVINDDVIYLEEPFYQDGIVAQAVDTVKARGVAYLSAAGNSGRQAYEAPFRPSGTFTDLGAGPEEAHDFDPGAGVDTCQQITLGAGQNLFYVLQWDQPFFSVSGAPGSAGDIDIVLYGNAGCTGGILAGSAADNISNGDPIEIFDFTNPGPGTTLGLRILHFAGPDPGLMKVVNFGDGTFAQFATASATSWGHSIAAGGLGVAAANYPDTPAFGTTPPSVAPYSSAGGTPILFDTAGNRLAAPQVRSQPAITAPDGVNTTFFFSGVDPEPDGFPNFFGTSAAAPHAAGVAALLLDRYPAATPDAVGDALRRAAIDMNDPSTASFDTGFDFATGAGLIQAAAALDVVPDLALTVTDAPDPVTVGDDVTYTLTVTNDGPDEATGITLTDTPPPGATIATVTPSQGSCAATSPISCAIGTLAVGGTATVTIVITTASVGTASNTASVTGAGLDGDPANSTRTVTTTVNPRTADLSIGVVDSPDPVTAGGEVTYAISVANSGPHPATGVVTSDQLPAGLTLVSATSSQGACGGSVTVSCALGAMPSGAVATVTVVVRSAAAGTLTSVASVGGNEFDPNLADNTDIDATTVTPAVFCAGLRATIVGTVAGETLNGTPRRDVIAGLGGNDVITGRGGDDVVCAGPGNDTVRGGAGRDILRGDAGKDALVGGLGADRLLGGAGNDTLAGDAGNDALFGGLGADRLLGGGGDDRLTGDAGRDVCAGGAGTRDRAVTCEVVTTVP